ncbi:MAG: DUF1932 domain-containing protein [Pseudomonadota bacterium]
MANRIAFLGFGEAAKTFAGAENWRADAVGFDIKLNDPVLGASKSAEFEALRVVGHHTNSDALHDAPVVLSLVTASEALAAAHGAAADIAPGSLFIDMNSAAPMRKREASTVIEGVGGHYLDAAIMAPVQPAALNVPLLLSGPQAEAAKAALVDVGFADVRAISTRVGDASTVKMIRSVMIKGVEALTAECLLAADAAGVVDEVVSSFGQAGAERANYNLERMLVHGERRASELDDVCATLMMLDIEPLLSQSAARYQRRLARCSDGEIPDTLEDKLALIRRVRSSSSYAARN